MAKRTITTPKGEQPPHYDGGQDVIVALRERGRDVEHPLQARQATFNLGTSPHGHVVCRSEGCDYISSLHAVLERRGQRLRVVDQDSRNGTFFGGQRLRSFDIGPGDVFTAATTEFLALDADMAMRRPFIAEIVGMGAHAAVDDALIAAIKGGPLLVVGEKGTEPERLAAELHQVSLRRQVEPIVIGPLPPGRDPQRRLIDRAQRSTMIVSATGAVIDEAFLSLALSPSYHIRLIAVAPSLDVAAQSLGLAAYGALEQVMIRPLRERRAEVLDLLDRLLLVEQHASVRTSDLREPNRTALARYRWPENLTEAREAAKFIAALTDRSLRAAVPLAGVARSTLSDWVDRLGLDLPLFPKKG